ncbi:hypothetical protein DOLIC_00030 [Dolichomitus sp. PSUC_FEM 10030005]|nr:hypothetical protein [Dolichomitus sp. PSUC_FEM 10030005]
MSEKLTYTENQLAAFIGPSIFYLYLHYFADTKRYLSLRMNDNYLDGYDHERLYEKTRDYYINVILPRIKRDGNASLNIEKIQERIMPHCRLMHSMLDFTNPITYSQLIERIHVDQLQMIIDRTAALSSNTIFLHGHENLRMNSFVKIMKALIHNNLYDNLESREAKLQTKKTFNEVMEYDILALPVYSLAGNDPLFSLYNEFEKNYGRWSIAKTRYYNRTFLVIDKRFIVYFDVCDANPVLSIKNHQSTIKAVAGSSEALASLPFRQLYTCIPTIDNPCGNNISSTNENKIKAETSSFDNGEYIIDFFSTLVNVPVFMETCLPMNTKIREPEDYIAAENCWRNITVALANRETIDDGKFNIDGLQEAATISMINDIHHKFSGTAIYIRLFDNSMFETYNRQIYKFGIFNITNHANIQIGRIIRLDGNNTMPQRPSSSVTLKQSYATKKQGINTRYRLADGPTVSTVILLESPNFRKIFKFDTIVQSQILDFYRFIDKLRKEIMLPVTRYLPFLFIAREISAASQLLSDGRTLLINKNSNIINIQRISMHSWYNKYTGILTFDTYRVWPRENIAQSTNYENENVTRTNLLKNGISIVRNIDNLHMCLRKMGLRPYGGHTRQILTSHNKSRLAVASLRITTITPSDISFYVYYITSRLVEEKMKIDNLMKDLQSLRDTMLVNATINDNRNDVHKMPLYVADELINYLTIGISLGKR